MISTDLLGSMHVQSLPSGLSYAGWTMHRHLLQSMMRLNGLSLCAAHSSAPLYLNTAHALLALQTMCVAATYPLWHGCCFSHALPKLVGAGS